MAKGGGRSVGGGAVAKIPEPVGDGAVGGVGKGDGQRFEADGGGSGKSCGGDQRASAQQGIGAVAIDACGKNDNVAEISRAGRGKSHDQVGGPEARQAEGRAGKDGERSAIDRSQAIAQSGPAEVSDREAGLYIGADGYGAEVEGAGQDRQLSRGQARPSHGVGGVAAVTGEGDDIAEVDRTQRSKADGYRTGLAGQDGKGTAGLDGEGRTGGDRAGESQVTGINELETERVGLADDDRSESQAAGAERELGRQIGGGDVAGASQGVGADGVGDGESDGIGRAVKVSMAEGGGRGVGSGAVAKIPEAVGNG